MKATKALVAAGLALMLGAGSAMAATGNNTGKIGVGPQILNFDAYESYGVFPGVSVRYWINDNWGLEGGLFYSTFKDKVDYNDYKGHTLVGVIKGMYAPVVKENSRFYVGLEGGLGQESQDYLSGGNYNKSNFYEIQPLMGFEFNFPGFKEIGFNVELGYAFTGWDSDYNSDYGIDYSGIRVGAGAHYYFQ
jgi:hypothetical protein